MKLRKRDIENMNRLRLDAVRRDYELEESRHRAHEFALARARIVRLEEEIDTTDYRIGRR